MDFDNLPQRVVRFSPRESNGDIMFGLPPLEYTAYVVNMNMLFEMDWRYDGHVWTVTKTSNIQNEHNLTSGVPHLWAIWCVEIALAPT